MGAKNDPHPEYGQTALQAGVSSGMKDCVSLILETAKPSSADVVIVNHEDSNKEAPIHVCCRTGNLGILGLVVEHGANLGLVDRGGKTALHCAGEKSANSYSPTFYSYYVCYLFYSNGWT